MTTTTRRTIFRVLAALASLPLLKAVEAEAAPDAALECAAQGGTYEQVSATEWSCVVPEPEPAEYWHRRSYRTIVIPPLAFPLSNEAWAEIYRPHPFADKLYSIEREDGTWVIFLVSPSGVIVPYRSDEPVIVF